MRLKKRSKLILNQLCFFWKHENGNDIDWDKMEEDFIRGSIITSFRIVNSEDYDLASMRYIDIT